MKPKSFILSALTLLTLSCSHQAEVDNQETTATVRVHVNDFSFSHENFPGATTRADDNNPKSYGDVKAVDIAIFEGSEKVYAATQLKGDAKTNSTFGEFECRLEKGDYTMVAVARNMTAGDEFTITSPTLAAYTTERARETFCCVQSIKVDGTKAVDVNPLLDRVMAKFQLVSTDKVLADAKTIRTTYSAGSKSFNPTTGLATDDNGFVVTNSVKPMNNGTLDVYSILFLPAEEKTMDITIEVLDKNDQVLISKSLPDVHFRINQVTKATGAVFTPGLTTLTFTLNTTWLPEEKYNF